MPLLQYGAIKLQYCFTSFLWFFEELCVDGRQRLELDSCCQYVCNECAGPNLVDWTYLHPNIHRDLYLMISILWQWVYLCSVYPILKHTHYTPLNFSILLMRFHSMHHTGCFTLKRRDLLGIFQWQLQWCMGFIIWTTELAFFSK